MDAYFARIQDIMQGELPSRIRFMLLDTIELRQSNWKPRHEVAGPRTIKDIRQESMREAPARKGVYATHGLPVPGSGVGLLPDPVPDFMARATIAEPSKAALSPSDSPRLSRAKSDGTARKDAGSPDINTPRGTKSSARKKTEKAELSAEKLANLTDALLEELLGTGDVAEAVRCVEDLRSPSQMPAVVERIVLALLDRKETERKLGSELLLALVPAFLDAERLVEGLRPIFVNLSDLALDIPHAAPFLALLCAEMLAAGALSLRDLVQGAMGAAVDASFCAALLKALKAALGEDKTRAMSAEAHFDLLRLPPWAERPEAEQREFLAAHGLEFLYPVLGVKQQLAALLADTIKPGPELAASARALAKALKEQLSAEVQAMPKFAKALAQALFEYVTSRTTLSGGPGHTASKEEKAAEKEMLTALLPVLLRYTRDKTDAQVDVIYALQVLCHANRSPKGLILRIAAYLYDLDVVEEAAWMRWREEVSDEDPGKGEALVDLNEYLNWMETAETEDEDED